MVVEVGALGVEFLGEEVGELMGDLGKVLLVFTLSKVIVIVAPQQSSLYRQRRILP